MLERKRSTGAERVSKVKQEALPKKLPSLRIIGDSNAVGYRNPPTGTKLYLEECLRHKFNLEPTLGRTRLSVLPTKFDLLEWCKSKTRDGMPETDFTLLIAGTNDITYLKKKTDELEKRVRASMSSLLRWVRRHTREMIVVVEPVNEMANRAEVALFVRKGMRAAVSRCPVSSWVEMHWKRKDLQVAPGSNKHDPHHFNRTATKRLAKAAVERVCNKGTLADSREQVAQSDEVVDKLPRKIGRPIGSKDKVPRKRREVAHSEDVVYSPAAKIRRTNGSKDKVPQKRREVAQSDEVTARKVSQRKTDGVKRSSVAGKT